MGDLTGSLAAVAVLLPQSMAFGVALLALADVAPATGAIAGLITAACLSLASGAMQGTVGLVAAPTGPTLVLLTASIVALKATGLATDALRMAIALVVVGAALVQMGLALVGGGRLIKYIPFPVVSGLVTGSAIMMVRSQWTAVSGAGATAQWASFLYIPAITAGVTLVVVLATPRVTTRVPGTLAGLVVGTIAFHVLSLVGPDALLPSSWMVGALPGVNALVLPLADIPLSSFPWALIASSSFALAVLASLDSLLTSVVADAATGARHNARRELLAQGIGHIFAGVLGGVAGSATKGATLAAIASGGRRRTGLFVGVSFVLLVIFIGPLGALLPVSALAGVVVGIALGTMLTRDPLRWLLSTDNREDGAIALLVATFTIVSDLMNAVGLGISIAVVLYVRGQARAPIVHKRYSAVEHRSLRLRDEVAQRHLESQGDRVVILELVGDVFFGTADRLFEELEADLARGAWVILDLHRVNHVDLTGVRLLAQLARRLSQRGGALVFASVPEKTGLDRDVSATFARIESVGLVPQVRTFHDQDEALEFAENALLSSLGYEQTNADRALSLSDMEITAALDDAQREALERALVRRPMVSGERVFRTGDVGRELFIVGRGEVDIVLETGEGLHVRLATCGPGTFFGEIAFLDPAPRVADARCVVDGELLVLTRDAFDELLKRDHDAAAGVLLALSRTMGRRLRRTDRELRRFAQR
jgi:SulP family sulfate permease